MEPPLFPHQIFFPFLDQDALKKETLTGGKEEDEVTLGSENKLWESVVSSPHGSEHLPTEHLMATDRLLTGLLMVPVLVWHGTVRLAPT